MKLVAALAVLCALSGCGRQNPSPGKRVVVLGIDGMDPAFVERHWDALPNLRRLAGRGSYQRLGTTMPPQSPVAWSTFSTGLPPDRHGVFDFVHRDPATMMPYSAIAELLPPSRVLRIGSWELPLEGPKFRTIRHGRAFWQILSDAGIPVTVLRMPANFPPVDCEGLSLAGMGVPDLKGTFGTFTYYSTDPQELARDVPGGRILTFQFDRGQADLKIDGPQPATLHVAADLEAHAARFEMDGQVALLKEGEWSDWIPVRFGGAHGMIKIYAKAVGEITKLYISPVNLDPVSPDLPLSTPSSYSKQLATRVGRYYTQGIAEDTAALRQGVLSRQEYLAQSALVAGEHLNLLHQALSEFREGLLFFHYFRIDQNSHMLWGKYEDELLASYQEVDRELAVVERMIGDASLMVLSDHGFTSFDRAVHVNSWLREQGWLHYKEGADDFQSVDWSRTKVYSLGLNAIYLNRQGREAHGILSDQETEALARELNSRLREFRDEGKPVVDSLVRSSGPDFLIGYARGYRSSWETALGAAPPGVIEDNVDAWIGDHCVDARHVPGVLLLNRKPRRQDLKLEDVTVTLLREFGISPPSEMTGVAF